MDALLARIKAIIINITAEHEFIADLNQFLIQNKMEQIMRIYIPDIFNWHIVFRNLTILFIFSIFSGTTLMAITEKT